MCNKNWITGCFGVTPPKGPFGIKIRYWWIFLLTMHILLATIGYAMMWVGSSMAIACAAGFEIPVFGTVVLILLSSTVTFVAAMRVKRYWKKLYGPWFTGVKLPIIKAKLPEINFNELANAQRLDKNIGEGIYEGPEQKFDGPEGL